MNAANIAKINEQALRRLIAAHATRFDEPLVLAVRYKHDDRDMHLLEVLEGFPGEPGEAPFETEFVSSPELLLVGKLHLTLVSPAELISLVENDAEIAKCLRADGTVEYYTSSARPLIEALGLKVSASSSEKQARQELLGEFAATVTPEEMEAIRKSWAS
ncbi:hypothetical protein WME89_06545 [Sorangium sp. So ce321]|uniref:hypothetical protein n=1 Tax=Sorangium sp. So ce321 TaxID=3133300 RepID=UPI003F602C7B